MIRLSLRLTLAASTISVAACSAQMLIEDETTDDGGDEITPTCPATIADDAVCDVPEGHICSIHEPDPLNPGSFNERLCGCWEASFSELRWHCYWSAGVHGECPANEPRTGQECFGLYGTECMYPERTLCTCSAESGAFSCEETVFRHVGPPPSSIPADQPIPALSDEERDDWCDWFVTARVGEGFPEPAPAPPDEDGYTHLRGCELGWEFPCLALIPSISSAECEANLRLSSCAAPISELSDCVSTVFESCWPSPHGCARYLERPGCSGTIAVSNDGNALPPRDPGGGSSEPSSCRIRIE
jgi:hypothetical protein